MTDSPRVLLTTADLDAWKSECARLTREIDERVMRRSAMEARITAAMTFLREIGVDVVGGEDLWAEGVPARVASSPKGRRAHTGGLPTWLDEIEKIVADEDMGLTYEDVKAGIELGPLAVRLKESEKGFYGGVGKLINAGRLVKHNGRLFTPEMYGAYMSKVAAGIIDDVQPSTRSRSPMGDVVLAFVNAARNGVTGGDVIDELRRHEDFAATVNRNKTAGYNVLKRLLDRGQLRKSEGRYYPLETVEAPDASAREPHEFRLVAEPTGTE